MTGVAPLGPMLGSLCVILLLLAGFAIVAKALRGRRWSRRGSRPIRIIASQTLGWQSSLLIVEAGGRRFLVGSSRAGLTRIGTLDLPDPAATPPGAPRA